MEQLEGRNIGDMGRMEDTHGDRHFCVGVRTNVDIQPKAFIQTMQRVRFALIGSKIVINGMIRGRMNLNPATVYFLIGVGLETELLIMLHL